jgi:hypothetical protein
LKVVIELVSLERLLNTLERTCEEIEKFIQVLEYSREDAHKTYKVSLSAGKDKQ